VLVLVRESPDQRWHRGGRPVAQRSQCASRIARHERFPVGQRAGKLALNRFCLGREVDEDADGLEPDVGAIVAKQVDQQGDRVRADVASCIECRLVELDDARAQEGPQERQRIRASFDQLLVSEGPGRRVLGDQASDPSTHRGGVLRVRGRGWTRRVGDTREAARRTRTGGQDEKNEKERAERGETDGLHGRHHAGHHARDDRARTRPPAR
jgi:hypothetical protein